MPLKLKRKYFGARGAYMSYLEKHALLYLYSSLDVATKLEEFKLKEKATDYT